MEKLLFDETKHRGAIFCRPLQNILNFCVNNFVGEPAKFEAEGTGYQDCYVVGYYAEEGAPEEDILPDPWNFTIYQHTPIAQLQPAHHPQFRKGTSTFAHIYSGIFIKKGRGLEKDGFLFKNGKKWRKLTDFKTG